jgi:hypothetical protein
VPRTTAHAHPLAFCANQIDPERTYTVRTVAALLGMAPSSVSGMATYGLLPGSRQRAHARGGSERTWTGKQLLRLSRRPVRVQYDHEKLSPATLYRVGCRCPVCVNAHSTESRARRRGLAEAAFTGEQRKRVLNAVAAGTPVADAAHQAKVTLHQVYGRATWDAEFAEDLDEAGWALCVLGHDDPLCGRPGAYRGYEQGEAYRPPCRGTGCREWRRDQAQQERTVR